MQTFMMRSLRPHIYSGEPRKTGSIYQAESERDARVMTMVGNSVQADTVYELPVQAHELVEAAKGKPKKPPKTPKTKPGRYIRRDQRAES